MVQLCTALVGARGEGVSALDESKAQAALRVIEKRIQGVAPEVTRLRLDLVQFRVTYPGTQAAIKAASLLATLPSPLDRLDPGTIPSLEKFDWQPKELVALLGEHRGRHGSAVTSVAFSHDNNLIASGGGSLVRIWDAKTMRLVGLAGSGAATSSVALSKDGKHLVSGTSYGGLYVYTVDPQKGPVLKFALAAATSPIYQVACHPDNKIVGAACFDNVVRLYDISGATLKEAGQVPGHTKAVRSLAFSPDGKMLATGSEDLTSRVWDMSTPDYREKSQLQDHTDTVESVAFSPSGKSLATGCSDGSFRIWTIPAAQKARNPRIFHQGPKGAITSLAFSATGNTLATCGGDNFPRLWNISTPKVKERSKLEGHTLPAKSLAYSPDMKLLVTGGSDWTVRTWDLTKTKPVERFVPWSHLSYTYSVAFAPDDTTLASGSFDRVVRFWDLARPEPRTRNYLKGDNIPIYSVAYSPDGKLVAAAGESTKIRQWEAATGAPRTSLIGHPTWVNSIAYSPNGKQLLSASGKEALLFEPHRGGFLHKFDKHETNVLCIGFSPDGKKALTGSGYYLIDKDGKYVYKDGTHVWTDCYLRTWDVEKGEEVASIKDNQTGFYGVAMAADGQLLYTSNYDSRMRIWNQEGGKFVEKSQVKGIPGNPPMNLLPSADGRRLLARGASANLVEWDAVGLKKTREWTFPEQIGSVSLTTDGRHLAVGLATGVVYILRLEQPPRKK
ncbi:MAG: WD40 repeat domain-containing protein [Gemmataceae bacterium]